MYKIRLLILLLISTLTLSCTTSTKNNSKFSVSYIGGGYDGLLLKNYLIGYLSSIGSYDERSMYTINANISHSSNVFITNIDNTSDREKVNTTLQASLSNKVLECVVFNENYTTSQFYIYAPSDKFLSNQAAFTKITKDNTEALVKVFINKLRRSKLKCNDS